MNTTLPCVTLAALLSLGATIDKSHACEQDPYASILDQCKIVCIGEPVSFDAVGSEEDETGSYDPDDQGPCGGGYGITAYEWGFPPAATDISGEDTGCATCKFIISGVCWVRVDVNDNDYPVGSDFASSRVTVVRVDKVVLAGTSDEGPLIAGAAMLVYLQALPYPAGSFPQGSPTWTIVSQPAGADAHIELTYPPPTALGRLCQI